MATRKNNFLNAKPVSRMGGGSSGVRKPSKPYATPASTSAKPKLKAKPQKPDARDVMPNSRAKKINLPSAANNAVPPKQGPTLKGTTPKTRISPNAARDSMPNSRAKGINLPKAANNAIPPKPGPSLRGLTPGLRSSAPTAASLGSRFASGLGAVATAGAMVDKAREVFNPKDNILTRGAALGRSIERVVGGGGGGNATPTQRAAKLKAQQNAKPSKPPLSSTGVRVSDNANKRDYQAAPTGSQQYNNYRNQQIAAERERLKGVGNAPKPVARPSASRPSQSTPSRSTASGSGSQRSAAPQPAKPAMPGRKWDDFNPGRGTSKSNNPLLDRDSGGMKLRDRIKQREASAQGEKAKNLSSNFGQDSGYQPQTKVDGSKYADKKPDMKKVNEYDRRKRRYYD